MSYNGSGTFNINTSGQPVVTGTVISSTAFNALTSDLGTGLSTAITKDGQTTATARIPFAAGINSSLVTDATSTTTGSIITAGGVGIAKALYVGTTLNVAGASTLAAITGTFNGTVGATTPSTGAFTTLSATGTITSTKSGYVLQRTGVDTGYQAINLGNTGADCYLGAERSTGSGILNGSTGYALVISNASNVPVQIGSNNVVVATFKQGGSLALENATTSTGCGITFPATQSASTDANTLDDYEEGTWTPSLGGTATYSLLNGNYVKVGRLVYAVATINVNAIGTGATNNITGLPFTNGTAGECNATVGYLVGSATSIASITGYVAQSGTNIVLQSFAAGGGISTSGNAIFANSTQMRIQAVYYSNT